MGKVIDLHKKGKSRSDHIITSTPWEFRTATWKTVYFSQLLRSQAEKVDGQAENTHTLPPHFILKGGMATTIHAMFTHRDDEKKMRKIYYLVGLMDCMINQVNPILRTDLLRDMYKKVFAMKAELNIHWHGTVDQVLLPIDPAYFNNPAYGLSLKTAKTLKALYDAIGEGTAEMFDILSSEYVFYCPWTGG
ncbi:MAG: hypothetical protein R6U38_06705 [Desulfatiglandaceae bacterium]